MTRTVNRIVVHSSGTLFVENSPGSWSEITANHLRPRHVAERGWKNVAYEYLIRRDGKIERPYAGTDFEPVDGFAGADGIDVCVVSGSDERPEDMCPQGGEPELTAAQAAALRALVAELRGAHPGAEVLGHSDIADINHDCPVFDLAAVLA